MRDGTVSARTGFIRWRLLLAAGAAAVCLVGALAVVVARQDRRSLPSAAKTRFSPGLIPTPRGSTAAGAPTVGAGQTAGDNSRPVGASTTGGTAQPGRGAGSEPRSTTTLVADHPAAAPPGGAPTTTTTAKPGDNHPPPTTTTLPPAPVKSPADYVPAYSVLAAYPKAAFVGPVAPNDPNLRPWDQAIAAHGATAGYARTWVATSGPGGYTVYAFQFPDTASAQAAASDAFGSLVTNYGAAPFAITPGVSGALIIGDCSRAYWTQDNFLRVVDVSTQSPPDDTAGQAQADTRAIVSALLAA